MLQADLVERISPEEFFNWLEFYGLKEVTEQTPEEMLQVLDSL